MEATLKISTSDHWLGPEPGQGTGRVQVLFLYSNTAGGNPFSFSSKTLAPQYRAMSGAVPVPAGLVVAPGSQGEHGTCPLCSAGTGSGAAEASVQDAGAHSSSLTINRGSALTEESSRM